jgi:CRP-like cAMP-binding protein
MNRELRMHDAVALLEDVPAKHFESGRSLLLHRGQIGTVVMSYVDGACEVEFADRDGRAYAMLPVQPDKLIVLYDAPDYAAA